MTDYTLHPVGYVRAPWKCCKDIPVQGGPCEIVIEEQFADALEGVDRGTHLIVMGYLDKADRTVLKARPRKLNPNAPACGVFACRSPVRPNPLSLTVVELQSKQGPVLQVTPLDLLDGTPIVDLKSYTPGWDCVFSARREQRVPSVALSDSQLMVFLQRDLRNHLGACWQEADAQRTLQAVFQAVRQLETDPRDEHLAASTSRLDTVADALMGLLGATFGNGRLRYDPKLDPAQLCFHRNGTTLCVAL